MLDLDIKIKNNVSFKYSFFNNRNSFPFSVIRKPGKFCNIPSNIFYMSVRADCLSIARGCNNQNAFLKSMNRLVRRMILQGTENVESLRLFYQQTSKWRLLCSKTCERITSHNLIFNINNEKINITDTSNTENKSTIVIVFKDFFFIQTNPQHRLLSFSQKSSNSCVIHIKKL